MRMSFANHRAFDPALDLMVHTHPNAIPTMLACFDFKPANSVTEGRDCVVVVGTRNHHALADHIAERARKAVVILCPGDKSFDNGGQPLSDAFVRIFTTNNCLADPRVTNIPLGVKSPALQLLRYARRHRPQYVDRAALYMNFAISSKYELPAQRRGLPHRKDIADRFRNEEWVTDRVFKDAPESGGGLYRYLTEVMQHKFVLSPEGFGIDCYRHWESLYLGAIPIVQRSKTMETFSDLPILFTDDYSEITESYLAEVYQDYLSRTFDFSRLYTPYYINLLVDAVSELEDPQFILLLSDERSMKERAAGSKSSWPAQSFLNRLSRSYSPYKDDLRVGNLIPSIEQDQRLWTSLNGAQISFGSGGSVIVEHASASELAGAKLELPTVRDVTYRVHGEMRSDDAYHPPQVEVIAAQASGRVYGAVHGVGELTKVDFTFVSAKTGAYLQFRPGSRAALSIKIEPVVDLTAVRDARPDDD